MDDRQRFIDDAVQNTLLQRLLQGRAREVPELPSLLQEFGLRFQSEQFAVMGLRLCGAGPAEGSWTPPPEPDIHGMAVDFSLCCAETEQREQRRWNWDGSWWSGSVLPMLWQ